MSAHFLKSARRPQAWLACVLTLLVHGLLVAYFASATVGNPSAGADHTRVLHVTLQTDETSLAAAAVRSPASSTKKQVSAIEKHADLPVASPAHELADLRGQHYFESRELTQKPLVAIDIPDNYALLVTGVPDQVAVLRLMINEYGEVDLAVIEDTVLPDDAKEMLAATFKRVKFHPGELYGRAVKSQLRIAIRLGEEVVADARDSELK